MVYVTKTVLITGHAGTIGPALCKKFIDEGYNVIGVSRGYNCSEYAHEYLWKMCEAHRLIEPYYLDAQSITLDKLMTNRCSEESRRGVPGKWIDNIKYVLHFGCPASPAAYQSEPEYTIESNTKGTENLIRLSQKLGARFIYASTSEVYGTLEKETFSEEDVGRLNSYGNRSCYDISKALGETITKESMGWSRDYSAGIVRIFNTYSEFGRYDDGRVINNFVYKLLNGEQIEIYGSGNQTRSFMYVSDLVDGVYRYTTADNIFEPMNLGNPYEYHSIGKLAEIICELCVRNQPELFENLPLQNNINYIDMDKDDPKIRKPDISKAKSLIGWEPKVKLEDGLKKVIDVYRKYYVRN